MRHLLLLLLLTACLVATAFARIRVRTVCQNSRMRLSCSRGYAVHIVSAFYGRASRRICRSRRHSGRRCSSVAALRAARRVCNGKRRCQLKAVSGVFGQPCKGVRKYLRVRYLCKFGQCAGIKRSQAKLIAQYRKQSRKLQHAKGKRQRKQAKKSAAATMAKVNRLRRRFRSCFDCSKGCRYLHYVERRFAILERRLVVRIRKTGWRSHFVGHYRARRSRWYLRRKLWYYRRNRRIVARHLKRCLRVCLY